MYSRFAFNCSLLYTHRYFVILPPQYCKYYEVLHNFPPEQTRGSRTPESWGLSLIRQCLILWTAAHQHFSVAAGPVQNWVPGTVQNEPVFTVRQNLYRNICFKRCTVHFCICQTYIWYPTATTMVWGRGKCENSIWECRLSVNQNYPRNESPTISMRTVAKIVTM